MTTMVREDKRSVLYAAMVALIAMVIIGIATQIVLSLTGYEALGRAIEPFTFGVLSVVFLLLGVYYRRKGKTLQSAAGYVGAALWALYTVLLIAGVG